MTKSFCDKCGKELTTENLSQFSRRHFADERAFSVDVVIRRGGDNQPADLCQECGTKVMCEALKL